MAESDPATPEWNVAQECVLVVPVERTEELVGSWSPWREELYLILKDGWPNCITTMFMFLPAFFLLIFLGGDPDSLAAAGMGTMFTNVTGVSLLVGFGSGSLPLISQAFGAQNFERCGELLQRQLVLHALICVAVMVLWLYTEELLVGMRQPSHIATLTQRFVYWRIPALPAIAIQQDYTNCMVAQHHMQPQMYIAVVVNTLNVLLFPPFISWLGPDGGPISMTMANILQAVLTVMVTKHCVTPSAWPKLGWTALRGWYEILALSLPAALCLWSEWWGWEITLFLAGLLCDPDGSTCIELDVYPIVSNTMVLSFMCHFGFSIAAGARVGNLLGAGKPVEAMVSTRVLFGLVACISGSICLILILLRNQWGRLFSSDRQTQSMVAQVLPFTAVYILFDALGPGAANSILRSVGAVKIPAIINVCAFYLLGIPVGVTLTFWAAHLGIVGLWIGLVLGMAGMVLGLLLYMQFGISWSEAARQAVERSSVAIEMESRSKTSSEYEQLAQPQEGDPDNHEVQASMVATGLAMDAVDACVDDLAQCHDHSNMYDIYNT